MEFALRAPVLEFRDPLAEFLGVLPPAGRFRYTYWDAVRLSGHSCPTVAGAYLMTVRALGALYPGEVPVRGEVEVVVGGEPGDGSAGPISQVIALLTGAATDTGFRGLMGRWSRRGLLRFDGELAGRVRFRRADTGRTVEVMVEPGSLPHDPSLGDLFARSMSGGASEEEARRFGELWQEQVAALLSSDPGRSVRLREIESGR
ncbi:MAG: hypothetical protein HY720_19065 [Planctomycetes bacterium]|nr:hypothetical protein [Planctomycetota bacterium]